MRSTKELLAQLAAAHRDAKGQPASDYRLAALLGVKKQTVSRYRNDKGVLDDAVALRIADLLQIERGLVLTWVHAERALRLEQRDVFSALEQLAARIAAGVLLAAGAATVAPSPAQAGESGARPAVCIMLNRRRTKVSPLAQAFAATVAALFPAVRPA